MKIIEKYIIKPIDPDKLVESLLEIGLKVLKRNNNFLFKKYWTLKQEILKLKHRVWNSETSCLELTIIVFGIKTHRVWN